MSNINKAAVLNPLPAIVDNIVDYIPRATTSKFGIVALGSGINVDTLGRIYLDTQEYSDRLTAIEAQAASSLATQKSEVAAAIAQVNLAQSQTITALTLEVSNLKTNLTASITATQTDLINRADQLAQNVTDITQQLTQDKAAFTKEIQDALVYLENASSVASALRTPRKIQGVDFDGTKDISLPTFTTQSDGLVPKREGATTTKYLREDGTWVIPPNTTYALLTKADAEAGVATTSNTISAKGLKDAILFHTPIVTNIAGNAETATKLQTSRTINGVGFDGSTNITLPLASTYVSGTVQLNNTLTGTDTGQALTAAQGKVLNDSKLGKTENAVSASKLQTSRTISLTGSVTGSVSFDGSANASIATSITGLGVANGIATLDSSGQVPSTQLPSYVDDVLEYLNVAAFPATGEAGKIYVETTGNTTYRWSGTGYVKITSGEVSSVAGKTGVVTLTKSDVGLTNVDNTADASKSVASAAKLTTARTINGIAFDGTANITITDSTKIAKGEFGLGVVQGSAPPTFAATTLNDIASWYSGVIRYVDPELPGHYGHGIRIGGGTAGSNGGWFNDILFSTGGLVSSRFKTNDNTWSDWTTHITSANISSQTVASAAKLQTARSIALSGAVTGTATPFDGSQNITITATDVDGSKISTGTIPAARIPTLNQNTTGSAKVVLNQGDVAALTGTAIPERGLSMVQGYHNGYPHIFGNSLRLGGAGQGEIYVGWSGSNGGLAPAFIRNKRDVADAPWSAWREIVFKDEIGILSAGTATKLATARTINDVSFDGSANITIADNTKLPLAGGTITGSLNVSDTITVTNVGEQVGAFKKLIQASTTTDGGYVAVGNHGSDKGYIELGTVDDPDAAIYARKRNSANTILDEAVILGPDGNTSFPHLVNARALGVNSADGSGVGLSLYGGAAAGLPNYGIAFAHASNFGGHGYVSGSEWATYFTMTGAHNRGWIFRSFDYGNVASISSQGNTQFNGSIVAGGNITAFSDARLKDNITKIPDALNKLNQLKGVTYTRKDLATDTQYAGLIAQDVQKVLPEAVLETEGDTLAVDYNGVIGLLVEAVKELSDRIEMLENK